MDKKITNGRRGHRSRRTAAAAAVTAALALVTAAAQAPAFAQGAAADTPPPAGAFSAGFGDCPRVLPAGVDRAQWRCEVMIAAGSVRLGGIDLPEIKPITLVHAEGPLPDGTTGQVFGSLRAEATPVPGGLFGKGTRSDRLPTPRLSLLPEYGGYADFLGTGEDRGALDMKFRLVSPALAPACTMGTDQQPVSLHLKPAGPSTWLSEDPPLIEFTTYDNTVSAPAATHCGPLGLLLNRRFALPSGAGDNLASFTAYYTFKSYDQLPASSEH
ncbi:hypothetical protein GA0115240_172013 [Streptomyces sp. DvalAA-14]|uniref:hypothetical protein n=1 Tax=unclassified Streptomyces TaxID=2593676 RepID=UPI00081B5B5A|nr:MULTISPECIES: hypothetical protein [unclassified Streptomyces]SCE50920.1 hypothetical protein GA0115240_172013 [Streptomyces sp. DvalAA-14]